MKIWIEVSNESLGEALGALMNEADRVGSYIEGWKQHITHKTPDSEIRDNAGRNRRKAEYATKYRDIMLAMEEIDKSMTKGDNNGK